MSDSESTPTEQPTEQAEADTESSTDWRAEARKWEARAKKNSADLAALADARQVAEDALQTELNQVKSEFAARQADLDRFNVALEKGLTASQARRLMGTNRDEFLADAEQLLADIGKPVPRPDMSQGPRSDAKRNPADEFADIIRQARG